MRHEPNVKLERCRIHPPWMAGQPDPGAGTNNGWFVIDRAPEAGLTIEALAEKTPVEAV